MRGMDRNTGKWLSGMDHLRQSIKDIITTTIGERLIVRDYGSAIFPYVGQPLTESLILEITSAVATALHNFEPRIQLQKVSVQTQESRLILILEGVYQNEFFVLDVS